MTLRLYNTLTRQVEPLRPRDPARVTFYSCGPTVYDDAHIGNFRSFLAADVLRRFIESPLCVLSRAEGGAHTGPRKVVHVMNITDVGHMTDDAEGGESGEDRMAVAGRRIAEAKKSGKLPAGVQIDERNPVQIARFYEARFREDARTLGLKLVMEADADPTLMPRATESIEGMQQVIARLEQAGYAYLVGEPGSRVVYFDVRRFQGYGLLSGNTLDNLREGEGGRVSAANQAQKRSPADFLLWKEDQSHLMKWDSPWGKGYPGWHIECTAMSVTRLVIALAGGAASAGASGGLAGFTAPDAEPLIDLHSGGEDNIFPHHECEIAQSCAAFNASRTGAFAGHWFHPRFLLVEGAKMSKSRGNFFTARDLFARGVEPAALRLALIGTHYRSNANFTEQLLRDAQRQVDRWRRVMDAKGGASEPDAPAREMLDAFASALHEDLNVAAAIAAVNAWVGRLTSPNAGDARVMAMVDAVLGVLERARPAAVSTEIAVYGPGVTADPRIEQLLIERRDARSRKDFARSDAIRDELAKQGLTIKDMPGGRVEVKRA